MARWLGLKKSVEVAASAILAATYVALVMIFHPVSFLAIQVRVADALTGFVPILGMPAVYGITLGVFMANLTSPLGPIDYLSFIPNFVGLMIVYKLRKVSVLAGLVICNVLI